MRFIKSILVVISLGLFGCAAEQSGDKQSKDQSVNPETTNQSVDAPHISKSTGFHNPNRSVDSQPGKQSVYTLYRNIPGDKSKRIHVANFVAYSGDESNLSNCQKSKELYQKYRGGKKDYWCEKGRFHK